MTTQRIVSPESQRNEYKSSWQDEYFECLCGFANARGGKLYVGVNDDGYVVGLRSAQRLLDALPNQAASAMGIVIDADHEVVFKRGENIKCNVVPEDIATKPENLFVRGLLTPKALDDIDADPENTRNATSEVKTLFDAAPGFVKQLRQSQEYRTRIKKSIQTWVSERLVNVGLDGSLEYLVIAT